MVSIIHKMIKWYTIVFEDWADPRNNDRFMMSSPLPVMTILAFYMYFVNYLGPKFMARRQPFKLDRILQLYNIFQIIINIYMFYKALAFGWFWNYNFFCEPIDFSNTPHAIEIARTVWLCFLVKVIDLLDTVFFVLRKKQNQVNFLHVYHHFGMPLVVWVAAKYLPGGHMTFTGLVNCFVHVIMYTYYLLTSMKINTSSWKKHITQLQLVQFFLIGWHDVQLFWVKDCGFPLWPAYFMLPQNIFIIILFGEFYYKTYFKKKPTIKTMPTKTETNNVIAKVSNKKTKKL